MVKKRIKIRPILVTLNILVLFVIIGFYTFRLVKYYLEENGNSKASDGSVLFVDALTKKQSYVDLTKGLVYNEDEKAYRFVGDVNDNYLNYSGSLYRIIEVDSSFNIRAVSENSFTYMYGGLNNGYDSSYINKWLNSGEDKHSGIFEKNVFGPEVLFNTTICEDKIDDLTSITCNSKNKENKFGILSLYDYAKTGGKSGYLNNGEDFFLNTLNKDNNFYYVTSSGELSVSELTTKAYGVRAVITISGDVKLLSGKGTKTNPYKIEKHDIKTLKDVYVGSILQINDNKYKVIDNSLDNVKVALVNTLKDDEDKDITKNFSSSNSLYSSSKNTLGYYLNNDYYKSLKENDLIVQGDWYIGKLSLDNLDYSNIYSSKVSLNVGMLTLGDMYINDVKNVFTILRGIEENKIIYVINEDGNFYGDFVSSKYGVRPAFYLKGDTLISGGEGNEDFPYKLEVKNGNEK